MSKLQELIVQYFEENEDKMIYDKIIYEIQTCETLWSAFSPVTKNHFVDYVQGRPTAFLFSEKEYCKDYGEHMKEEGYLVGSAECSKENRLAMFTDYHRSGFECVIVDNGKRYLLMELTDLINVPDYESEPEENRPIINPDLLCSADRFFQCLAANTVTPDKEINLLVDTYYAKYLIPIEGKIENNQVSIPGLERSDGVKVVPYFTDIAEYRKFDQNNRFRIAISDYTQIESFCNAGETVVINPMGFNFTLTKKTADAVRNALNAVPKNGKAERAVIYQPDRVPVALVDGLNTLLDQTEGVKAGYIKGLRKKGQSQLLVIIDCGDSDEERTKEILDMVREEMSSADIKEEVDYIPASSGIGQTAAADSQPFFERVIVDVSLPPENADLERTDFEQ